MIGRLLAPAVAALVLAGQAHGAAAGDYDAQRAVNEEVGRLHQEAKGLSQAGRYDEALRAYRRILAIKPEDLDAQTATARVTAWKGQHARAEQLYREVLGRKPDHADALAGLGDVRSWRGDLEGARQAYERAVAASPNHVDALKGLGKLSRWEGDAEASRRYYAQALRWAPTDPEVRDAIRALGP